MKNWIKRKLRKFLGVDEIDDGVGKLEELYSDLVSIGVDVHFQGQPHMILIYSRLNGGQIREIPARFKDMAELNDFVKWLKNKYKTDCETLDMPFGMAQSFSIGGGYERRRASVSRNRN